jgi:nucleotide-binding universal stress UspA family protein
MYKQILLASDGALESLVALREGALIARALGARAHLLIIDRDDVGRLIAEATCAQPGWEAGRKLLDLGLDRLKRLGVAATGEVMRGDPAQLITQSVRRTGADLIVVGHRRQTFLERWWTGPSGAYIVDGVPCSVLIARDTITDEEFEAYLDGGADKAP